MIFFLDLLARSPFIPVQNVVYFTILPFFLGPQIIIFYTNSVLNLNVQLQGQRVKYGHFL